MTISKNYKHSRAAKRAKVQLQYLPVGPLGRIGKVFEIGAQKYGHLNWRETKMNREELEGAMLRHLFQHLDGMTDEDHIAHLVAAAMVYIDCQDQDMFDGNLKVLPSKIDAFSKGANHDDGHKTGT